MTTSHVTCVNDKCNLCGVEFVFIYVTYSLLRCLRHRVSWASLSTCGTSTCSIRTSSLSSSLHSSSLLMPSKPWLVLVIALTEPIDSLSRRPVFAFHQYLYKSFVAERIATGQNCSSVQDKFYFALQYVQAFDRE